MREIRRKDRILDQETALEIIKHGEFGVLSMVNADGGGYGIPLSFASDSEGNLYFHCAPEGHKLENLRLDPRVTFTIVGPTQVIPEKFTTLYQSVILFGEIEMDLPEEERFKALRLILQKYSPEHLQVGEKYMQGSFHRTNILKMNITAFSAKCKK